MTQLMRALGKLAAGLGELGLRDIEVRQPGAGEALVEVYATGICGTDLHIADDEFPSEPPVTMGHEVTGVVSEVGAGVDAALIGTRVACETYFSYCEQCEFCRSGRPNLCAERRSIGSREDGGFAPWLTIPARNLWRLPDHVGEHAGALAEPLACVCRCLFDPPVVNDGDTVLVIGPGTMGLLTAQAARAAGGDVTVVGLERDKERLALASTLGLPAVVLGHANLETAHVVAECSGSFAGAAMGLQLVVPGGRYVQVGIFGDTVELPFDEVLFREITVTSGNASTPDSWRRAIGLLEQNLIELDPLVTDVHALDDWAAAFAATRARKGVKHVIDPRR